MNKITVFLTDFDKDDITVGFSKNDIKNHKGIYGLKYYLLVMYLRKHLETFGEITLTLNKLIDECGYSTKSHNDFIYSDFKQIIKEEIIDKEYGTVQEDILKIKPMSVFTIKLSSENNLFFSKDNFVQISISEYEAITKANTGKINKAVLLGVYLFIKQYIFSDSEMTNILPRISYPSKQQIKKGIGVSSINTIENAISILADLKLIYIRGDMYVENSEISGEFVPTRNVFALNKEDLNSDVILIELEKIYGKTVYNKDDVPGKIAFLQKLKNGDDD